MNSRISAAGLQEEVPDRTPTPDFWPPVERALANPRWKWRTAKGIARDTGIPQDRVQELLDEHRKEIRVAPVFTSEGDVAYMPRSRKLTWRDHWWYFRVYLSRAHY